MGQSIKTSFAILVGFILVDNLLPKRFLQRSKVWLFGFVGVAHWDHCYFTYVRNRILLIYLQEENEFGMSFC